MRPPIVLVCAAVMLVTGCGGPSGTRTTAPPAREDRPEAPPSGPAFTLESPAFTNGRPIPKEYTGEGANFSPPLAWSGVPEGAKSFGIVCSDPDAPAGTFYHWVVLNIPAETTSLPQAVSADFATSGANSAGTRGYMGPMPPPGKPHRYFFRLYALDAVLTVEPGTLEAATAEEVMAGHMLATAELMGTYQR